MAHMITLGQLITPAPIVKCGEGSYPVLSMTMRDGIVLQSDRFKKSLASTDQSNYKVVRLGQLVVGFPIDEGVLYVQKIIDEGIMSPAYNVWNINTNLVDADYLELALHSPYAMDYYKSKLRGTTARRRSLPTNELLALPLLLPDFETQVKIVSNCRKANELIALRKEQLAKLDQLVKSRFIELFGATSAENCTKQIKDYAEVLGGYAFKSDLFCSDAIPVIRISNINNGCVELDYNICFDELFWEQNKRFRVEQNDVLMAMSGATTGKAGVYRENMPALINQRVACIRAKDGVACPTFLFVATQLEWMYDLIQETSAGCAQPNISGKQIENMPVPDASYEQQQQFASFVEQTDKSKLAIQQSLDKLELLKKSLMQQYFG